MDLKGRLLGNRYEIIEKIGSGGMATVYKAKCRVLNRYVAIKILREEFTTDEEFIKRFEDEAQSAASITHPNIVSVYDVCVEDNLYYIVMELIKGKTLKEIIIEEKGPLPWKWSVNIAIQIASALEVAHKNNIVHRDIKPHNIIITEEGVAKVTDFGIAKAVSNSTITAFGTTIGSVHYFSPEHARGGYTDAKSDLYSLGVVMYEMLTGKVPFDADTPVSIALKHMQEEPTEAIKINEKIPTAINSIIMKALRKETSSRYQNATEMLNDLKRAIKEPNGNFVDNNNEYVEDFPTQRISTLGEERSTKVGNKKEKKSNKFIMFVKKHKVLSSIVGLCLLFAISLGGTIGIANATRPKDIEIPNLLGKTIDEAKQILEENKITLIEEDSEYNAEYEVGQIMSQNPPYVANRKIKQNTEMKVVVSLGAEKTKVPVLKGEEKESAEQLAKDAKLKLEIIEETSETVPAGTIIKQEIEPETEVNAGDTIKVYVSIGTGIEQVVVTSVYLKDEATAKAELEGLGLVVEVEYEEKTDKENGVVLKQSKASGDTVDVGSTIKITVNKLAETKDCEVKINVAKLTGYVAPTTNENTENEEDEENNENEEKVEPAKPEKVTVIVYVNDSEYDRGTTTQDNTEYKSTVSGTGSIKVKIEIMDSKGKNLTTKTKTVNLNNAQSITFDK